MLKAYEMDDEGTVYAAHDHNEAINEFISDFCCEVDADYPRELTAAELDKDIPDYDEHNFKTGEMTSVRNWLNKKTVGGFLCGLGN